MYTSVSIDSRTMMLIESLVDELDQTKKREEGGTCDESSVYVRRCLSD